MKLLYDHLRSISSNEVNFVVPIRGLWYSSCILLTLFLAEHTFLVGTVADFSKGKETQQLLRNYGHNHNPYGIDLFFPNPIAQIIGWASNLFY